MAGRSVTLRVLQVYWRLSRSLTLGVQGIVIDGEGRVLLVRHGYRPGWHFPGGGVEKNELVHTALVRELREEVGVLLEGQPRLIGIFANFRIFPSDHVVLFEVRQWTRPSVPEPNSEIVEQGFFPVDSLPEGTVTAVRRRLAELSGVDGPSQEW